MANNWEEVEVEAKSIIEDAVQSLELDEEEMKCVQRILDLVSDWASFSAGVALESQRG